MASRRMVSIKIVESARFIKMPVSCQALYFHLVINADDDGIVEAYSLMRILGCSEDDIKILSTKGFIVVLNEDLVSFISDWHEHNLIRADRKVDSIYKDLLIKIVPEATLIQHRERADVRAKKASNGQTMDSEWTLNGRHRLGKDSIGKVSIDKDKEDVPSKPKPSKKYGAPSGTQTRVLELYTSLYESLYHSKPSIAFGRIGKTIKDLEKVSSLEELEKMIQWAMTDNKYLSEIGHPCEKVISSDTLNRFRATKPRQTATKKVYFDKEVHCPCCYRISNEITVLPSKIEDGYTCKCGMSGSDIRDILKGT